MKTPSAKDLAEALRAHCREGALEISEDHYPAMCGALSAWLEQALQVSPKARREIARRLGGVRRHEGREPIVIPATAH